MSERGYMSRVLQSVPHGRFREELCRRVIDQEKAFFDWMKKREFPPAVTVGGVRRVVPGSVPEAYRALADGLRPRIETADWRLMILCGWDTHLSPTIGSDGRSVVLFNERFIFGKRLAHGVYELSAEWIGGDWSFEDAGRVAGPQEEER